MMKKGAIKVDTGIAVVRRVVARNGKGFPLPASKPDSADGGRTLN
jgi:hypothetical protein